jgi:Streptomyces sporulation and cell division protein, SsgA
MTISATVSAELGLRLVAAEQTIVPLVASLHYSGSDPYAIRMAFHVGPEDPVEWIFARELFADGMITPEGNGDVQIWPSVTESPPVAESTDAGYDAGGQTAGALSVLNIKLSSPFGEARFEAPTDAIANFLDRTYGIVPMGRESAAIDIDGELSSLLGQT